MHVASGPCDAIPRVEQAENHRCGKGHNFMKSCSFLVFVNATTGWFHPLQNLAGVEWWYVLGDFLLNAGRHSQMLFLQFFFGEKEARALEGMVNTKVIFPF